MRSPFKWGLLALVALSLLALAKLLNSGAEERDPVVELAASERPSPTEALLQPISREAVREALPEVRESEEESEEEIEPPSEDEVVSDSGDATLVVTLVGGGRPVGPGVLQIDRPVEHLTKRGPGVVQIERSGGEAEIRNVDSMTGQALFEGLSPGRHWIRLFQLPSGWLPPRTALSDNRDGAQCVVVEIGPGANACEIVLERPVHVFGRVLGPNSEPLDKTRVVFTPFDSAGARTRSPSLEFAVAGGRYEGELYDGIWSAEVLGFAESKAASEGDSLLADLAPPLPQVRMFHTGSSVQLDFDCERVSGMIEGHVVDECGRPFRGLRLLASRETPSKEPEFGSTIFVHQRVALALSAEDGSFVFRNLVQGPYRVAVEYGEFLAVTRPGVNLVGEPVEPVDVQLGADNSASIEMTVRRSHPVRVRGSIETIPDASTGRGAELPAPSLFLKMASGPGGVTRWAVDSSGWRFDFYVEAAVSEFVLEVDSAGRKATYPLTLSPEPPPLVLRFPQ